MLMKLLVILLLATNALCLLNDGRLENRFRGHVTKANGQFEVITALESEYDKFENNLQDSVATAFWDQTYNITGWSVLEIRTFANGSNQDQAYAAGLLEGQLTKSKILQLHSTMFLLIEHFLCAFPDLTDYQWMNSINDICSGKDEFCHQLSQYLSIQLDWIYSKIEQYPEEEYWQHVDHC